MRLTRRSLLACLSGIMAGFRRPARAAAADSPLRIYYNDDATDLVTLSSPFHDFRAAVSQREIDASIDEIVKAGADAYVIEPGTGWVPLWKSAIYPAADHARWLAEAYKVPPSGLFQFMAEGGDLVAACLKRCRTRGIPILASFRLNDLHTITFSGRSLAEANQHMHDPGIPDSLRSLPLWISRVHADHPEWRFDAASAKPADQLWDWSHPQAVAHKLALCTELVQSYDLDGLELDFMRFPRFFGDGVPESTRVRIMSRFIEDVRSALDKGRKGRDLALRVPPKLAALAPLGLRAGALGSLGVDRLNLSHHTFTSQDVDFDAFRREAAGLRLTLELAQAKQAMQKPQPQLKGSNDRVVLAAPADLLSTALLAQAKGFDSLSLFNFAYYRRDASKQPVFAPTSEPPFEVIRMLKDPARAPLPVRSWFLSTTFVQGFEKLAQMPANVVSGRPTAVTLQIAGPRAGRDKQAILRFDAVGRDGGSAGEDVAVTLNGQALARKTETGALGLPEALDLPLQAFQVPPGVLREGSNAVTFTTHGAPCKVMLCEILAAG